jgi:pyruvate/2-oxoglutarate dehydrogenase complex dihydrolipoamide acyltransferase (E2) component
VLEAMKMETPVVAPYEAVVRAIHVAEGDRVAGGTVLVELEDCPLEGVACQHRPKRPRRHARRGR